MDESRQYVVDAHSAIKMQKVTVKQPLLVDGQVATVVQLDDDGKPVYDSAGDPVRVPVMVNGEEYKEFRDIGAMAPALNAAKSITEMLGTADGELSQGPQITGGVHLSVIMPRMVEAAGSVGSPGSVGGSHQPAIEGSCETVTLPEPPSHE
jgi:hypothetical protein